MLKVLLPAILTALAMIAIIPRGDPAPVPQAAERAQPVPAAPDPNTAGNGMAGVTLPRAADGHFYADVRVNGATIRFLIDSGASAVVLTRADAQAAGIAAGPGDFTAMATGAGGEVRLKPIVIDRVALGPVSADRVDGAVAESGLPVSLLGQTFLQRVSHVEIAGDEMRMR